jgi:hypothetical protein
VSGRYLYERWVKQVAEAYRPFANLVAPGLFRRGIVDEERVQKSADLTTWALVETGHEPDTAVRAIKIMASLKVQHPELEGLEYQVRVFLRDYSDPWEVDVGLEFLKRQVYRIKNVDRMGDLPTSYDSLGYVDRLRC